ncbi:MAG TPA: hypothetical protein VIY53_07270 [Acidobacteriaceae bacterium]
MRKTTLLGINMERQTARRRLVVAVYAFFALLILGGWRLDHLHETGIYVYFAAMLVNWRILGGYGSGGLIKPFTGKGPRNQPMPSNLVELELRAAGNLPAPDRLEYRNDERELERRDRVHYQAYQGMVGLLGCIWLFSTWQMHPPRFVRPEILPFLLYALVLPAIVLAVTLPQAILLWTEPDMEMDLEEERTSATVNSAR